MSILIVVAHPDDEVLIAGASIARWVEAGVEVTACILAGGAEARTQRPGDSELADDTATASRILGMSKPILGDFPNIAMNTVPHLALVQFVESAMRSSGARTLITHHPGDINDDHHQTSRACQAAARLHQRNGLGHLHALAFGEVPSSTDWSIPSDTLPFTPTAFVDVKEEHIATKLKALATYQGVMRPHPHPRSDTAIRALAHVRGAASGMPLAEAFQVAFLDGSECLP